MKKVLFLSAVVLSMLVGCKKNDAAEKPVQESDAQIEETVQESVELSEEQKEEKRIEDILNDNSLDVYQKMEAIGYQSDDILKFNYRKNSDDLSSWREREINYDENYLRLTKDKLMSTVWILDKNVAETYILLFYSDGYFVIGGDKSGPSAIGKYTIKREELSLSAFSYDPAISFYGRIFGVGDVKCRMNFRSSSFFYDSELVLRDIVFFPEGSVKAPGSSATVDDAYLTIKNEQKVISENIKFYARPSADSNTQNILMYREMFPEGQGNGTDVLKRGTVVSVCGVASGRSTIKGVTGNWYYVSLPALDGLQYGWIFGSYFVDYDASRKVEYDEILKAEFNSPSKEGYSPFTKKAKLDLSDSSKYQVHDVTVFLNYEEEDGWNIKVYDSPEMEKEISTIKKGDDVRFSRYVTTIASNKTTVEAETSSGFYGFIPIRNPYRDGQFEYLETLSVDGKDVEVLKLDDSFGLYDDVLKALPSDNSETVYEMTHEDGGKYYKSTAITSDYQWVKMYSDKWEGWVHSKELSKDKGGPTIDTPIIMIEWELKNCNLI